MKINTKLHPNYVAVMEENATHPTVMLFYYDEFIAEISYSMTCQKISGVEFVRENEGIKKASMFINNHLEDLEKWINEII